MLLKKRSNGPINTGWPEIDRIFIHHARATVRLEQIAELGSTADPSMGKEVERIQAEVETIEAQLRRRRVSLEEQKAIYGISADPSIQMEIDDIVKYFQVTKQQFGIGAYVKYDDA